MDIKDFLDSKALTQTELADRIGVTQAMIYQWVKGIRRVTAERAIDIERATEGLVTRQELRPDIFVEPMRNPRG